MDFNNTSCLIVGGGDIALHKTRTLLKSGAKVTVLARSIKPELTALFEKGTITVHQKEYTEHHHNLADYFLVVAATDDKKLNHQLAIDCKNKKIPINVTDNGELSSFVFPAIIERNPITIAISSDASSPVLSRLLRGKIESAIPFQYGGLAKLAKKYRDKVKATFQSINHRRHFWESVFQGKVADKMLSGSAKDAESLFNQQLANFSIDTCEQGEVYLVGAGPGDPELLTFKALRLMQQADVVFYDRLVSDDILSLTRRDAKMIYVGKKSKKHALPQDEINTQLIAYAKKGHRVLRLKGGDPFIFGRGGEEAEQLIENQIDFQVVPGITSAAGASSYCGIPLTHRDYAHSVTFVTGHLQSGANDLDWAYLAQKRQTLVVYMGLASLALICKNLIHRQLAAATPIAIIQNATRPDQLVLTGTLDNIEEKVKSAGIVSPALIIIGEVVKLHAILND